MTAVFDADAYWLSAKLPVQAESPVQEALILAEVRRAAPKVIYEIGCGWGRITKLLSDNVLGIQHYDAIELAPARAAWARRVCQQHSFVHIQTENARSFLPATRPDLVIAVNVLMHIPEQDLSQLFPRLVDLAGHWMITVDWHEGTEAPSAEHNFQYLYAEMYRQQWRLKELRVFPLHDIRQSIFVAELK